MTLRIFTSAASSNSIPVVLDTLSVTRRVVFVPWMLKLSLSLKLSSKKRNQRRISLSTWNEKSFSQRCYISSSSSSPWQRRIYCFGNEDIKRIKKYANIAIKIGLKSTHRAASVPCVTGHVTRFLHASCLYWGVCGCKVTYFSINEYS